MRIPRRSLLSVCLLCLAISKIADPQTPSPSNDSIPNYRNPNLAIDDRVAELLSRMTLEEKVEQLVPPRGNQVSVIDATGTFTNETARQTLARYDDPDFVFLPKTAAILHNAMQRYQREKTRLGIPLLFAGESLHGFMEYGSTSFPQALGLASTWDPALVKQVFAAAGDEARSSGTDWVFTPVLDLARDPRWGRTEETYGEDPYLVSRMAVAAVTGLQGDEFLVGPHHVMATMKHFAVHGQPEGGTNTAPGNYSERVIRENFLVPFESAVKEARVGSVMASYNEIDGVPSHINHWLLEKVLRQEWGFDGYVSSDDNGLQMLVYTHHVAYNLGDAARMALAAGVDFDVADAPAFNTLADQVKNGTVPLSEVDRALARVLAAKFRLGLFDHPYVDPDYAERVNNGPEHKQLALETARKSLVLLKNEKNLLPLDLSKLKTIAVIGPNAGDVHLGGYSRDPGFGISVLDGIRARVGAKAKVLYEKGCSITNAPEGFRGWWANGVELVDPKTQADSIKAA